MTDTKFSAFLILGATGSVGSTLSRRLVDAGHHVLATGRDRSAVEQLSQELGCSSAIVDATDVDSIERAVAKTVDEFGRIDGAANCIGSVLLKPAHLTSDQEWHETITVNLTSSFALLRSVAKRMRKQGGSVVLVSSAAARVGISNHEAIAAAKAGIVGLTLSAAASYASHGIRVNAVAPGLVKSKMTRRLWEQPAAAESSIGMHALARLGEPSDIAAAIDWLLHPSNDWVTGQVIGIDGGLGSVLARAKK